MIDGSLAQGMRGTTSWGYSTQLALWHKNNILKKKENKKTRFKRA